MKKNTMMRLASVLLICVLLTTSTISGTFAKYVTENSGSDSARVAKWGVDIDVSGSLFDYQYKNVSNGNTPGSTDVTVLAYNGSDKLVAPGTQNDEGITFKITGKPEVSVKLEVKITDADKKDVFLKKGTYDNYITAGDDADKFTLDADYYPIVYTLKNDIGNTLVEGNLAKLEAYLEQENNPFNKVYVPNTQLEEITGGSTGTYTLTWKWAFEQEKDAADTMLGNLQVDGTLIDAANYCLDVAVPFTITVTQVD